ncbi:MAG: membrane protein insertase YidC [Dehalococcoidia bacterium]|nr:membrane protein insertase YidC [Dehalococcoidia bacterium]
MDIGSIWNNLFQDPMLNGLIILYGLLWQNFAITIVVFTIVVRLIMLPFTIKQLQATKGMQVLQPKMAALQKRYAGDRPRLSQEQMKLYKEHGVNPLGCAVPTIIQFPIWIGLYQSILLAMAVSPESLVSLSEHLYSWMPEITKLIPLKSEFLWLDLSKPDKTFIFPILVAGSTWFQQKMTTTPSADPKQQQMNSMMQNMMPLMLGFFALQFASGLAIYWVVSNICSMVIQYFVIGMGGLTEYWNFAVGMVGLNVLRVVPVVKAAADEAQDDDNLVEAVSAEKRRRDGRARSKRKNSRGGNRAGTR